MVAAFHLIAAVLASIGGAAAILLGLSSWLAKVWANRILERERAELAKLHQEYTIGLQEISAQRQDALFRKRDVYAQLATSMRILLRSELTPEQKTKLQQEFLDAYAKAYLWASEPVAATIADLLQTAEKKAPLDQLVKLNINLTPEQRNEQQGLDRQAQEQYQRCMREMRKDSGFAEPTADYRLVGF